MYSSVIENRTSYQSVYVLLMCGNVLSQQTAIIGTTVQTNIYHILENLFYRKNNFRLSILNLVF